MAVANLFGSHLFNMVVLAIDDVAYPGGPLLSHVSPAHSVTIITALLMTGVATVGLIYRPTARPARAVSW